MKPPRLLQHVCTRCVDRHDPIVVKWPLRDKMVALNPLANNQVSFGNGSSGTRGKILKKKFRFVQSRNSLLENK